MRGGGGGGRGEGRERGGRGEGRERGGGGGRREGREEVGGEGREEERMRTFDKFVIGSVHYLTAAKMFKPIDLIPHPLLLVLQAKKHSFILGSSLY